MKKYSQEIEDKLDNKRNRWRDWLLKAEDRDIWTAHGGTA
jgi:hypothetical protein